MVPQPRGNVPSWLVPAATAAGGVVGGFATSVAREAGQDFGRWLRGDRGPAAEGGSQRQQQQSRRRQEREARAEQIRTPFIYPGEQKDKTLYWTQAVDSTGFYGLLNGMQRGTNHSQRLGWLIRIRSIYIKFRFLTTPSTGLAQTVRYILFVDNAANAVGITNFTDLLETKNVASPLTLVNRTRFRVLLDRTLLLGTAGGAYPEQVMRTHFIRFKYPLHTYFNSADTGGIGDIVTGAINILVLGTNAAGTTAGSLDGYTRTRYTDK